MSKLTETELEKVLHDIVEDDSLNPRINPTKAKPDAWERWQKAKQIATVLQVEGVLDAFTEEVRQNGEVMSIIWNPFDDYQREFDTQELIDFLSCFDHIAIDSETWHCTCHVYKE